PRYRLTRSNCVEVPMNTCPPETARRLLYILHRGFVEARLLALGQRHQQLFDLSDALENFPCYLNDWQDEHMELIRFNLETYQKKYPGISFDYMANLERDEVPETF